MDNNYLSKLSSEDLRIAKIVGQAADQRRVSAYLVGGVVRDLMLKRPNHDLDFVIEGDAIAIAQEIASQKKLKITVYKQFGTATIFWKNNVEVDFVSARKETYETSGALPSVQRGSLKDDLFRRDFTINALALSVNAESFGQLIDVYGGVSDLKKKVIRVLHAQSFADDPTRILRALRFAVRLNFEIEPATLKLLRKALKDNVFQNIKRPRLFQEFKKTLDEANVVSHVHTLEQSKVLSHICPGLKYNKKSLQNVENYLKKTKSTDRQWIFVLMVLVSEMQHKPAEEFLKSIQLNSEDEKSILQTLSWVDILTTLNNHLLKPGEVYMILRSLRLEAVEYLYLQAASILQRKYLKRYLEKDVERSLKISGDDLKKIGVLEGKRMKEILEGVLLAKINGTITTKTDELKFARSLLVTGVPHE